MNRKADRDRILIRSSWVSTIGNAILSAVKMWIGFISGSLAVIGDGIDSATDVIISIAMLFTAKIVNKPPSTRYPFGYEKAESIATKILSMIIFYAGIQMLISSVQNIFSGEARELPGIMAIYVTVFSILGKLALALYQYRQGRRAGSPMLTANAKNMRNDVIISLGVLVGLFFTFVLDMAVLDSVTGLVISLFIIRSAIGIFLDSNAELMDGVSDLSVYDDIFEAVDQVRGASNPHRVRSRQIGTMYMISLDIEVDSDITLNQAHDIAEAVEKSIILKIGNVYDIVVHVEPSNVAHPQEKFGVDKKTIK